MFTLGRLSRALLVLGLVAQGPPILDRLLHHSFTPMTQGERLMLEQKRKAGLLGRSEKAANGPRRRE